MYFSAATTFGLCTSVYVLGRAAVLYALGVTVARVDGHAERHLLRVQVVGDRTQLGRVGVGADVLDAGQGAVPLTGDAGVTQGVEEQVGEAR
ncbi:hypothetical protein GCM10020358_23030 [Amorphoplanes nipponensis]